MERPTPINVSSRGWVLVTQKQVGTWLILVGFANDMFLLSHLPGVKQQIRHLTKPSKICFGFDMMLPFCLSQSKYIHDASYIIWWWWWYKKLLLDINNNTNWQASCTSGDSNLSLVHKGQCRTGSRHRHCHCHRHHYHHALGLCTKQANAEQVIPGCNSNHTCFLRSLFDNCTTSQLLGRFAFILLGRKSFSTDSSPYIIFWTTVQSFSSLDGRVDQSPENLLNSTKNTLSGFEFHPLKKKKPFQTTGNSETHFCRWRQAGGLEKQIRNIQ